VRGGAGAWRVAHYRVEKAFVYALAKLLIQCVLFVVEVDRANVVGWSIIIAA
jgi:hypothetical protein